MSFNSLFCTDAKLFDHTIAFDFTGISTYFYGKMSPIKHFGDRTLYEILGLSSDARITDGIE